MLTAVGLTYIVIHITQHTNFVDEIQGYNNDFKMLLQGLVKMITFRMKLKLNHTVAVAIKKGFPDMNY